MCAVRAQSSQQILLLSLSLPSFFYGDTQLCRYFRNIELRFGCLEWANEIRITSCRILWQSRIPLQVAHFLCEICTIPTGSLESTQHPGTLMKSQNTKTFCWYPWMLRQYLSSWGLKFFPQNPYRRFSLQNSADIKRLISLAWSLKH